MDSEALKSESAEISPMPGAIRFSDLPRINTVFTENGNFMKILIFHLWG